MKKLFSLLLVLSVVFLLSGCVNVNEIKEENVQLEATIAELQNKLQQTILEKEIEQIKALDELEDSLKDYYEKNPIVIYEEVEVTPDGYVDSYYYCHEKEVEAILIDVYGLIGDIVTDTENNLYYKNGQIIVGYEEVGYDGFPTIVIYNSDGSVDFEYDVWDYMYDFCSFEPYDGYYGY